MRPTSTFFIIQLSNSRERAGDLIVPADVRGTRKQPVRPSEENQTSRRAALKCGKPRFRRLPVRSSAKPRLSGCLCPLGLATEDDARYNKKEYYRRIPLSMKSGGASVCTVLCTSTAFGLGKDGKGE